MHGITRAFAVLSLFGVGSLPASFACADDPPSDKGATSRKAAPTEKARLALEIQRQVEDLQAVRRQRRQWDEQHLSELATVERQIEMLQRQLQPIETALVPERRELTQLRETVAGEQKSADESRAWIKVAADAATPVLERMARRVEFSTADDAPRRAGELRAIATLLNNADPLEKAKGLQQIPRAITEQWAPSRSIELANQRIEWNNGKNSQHGWVFQLGTVSKLFVTEDGQTIGIWSGDAKSPWRLDLPPAMQSQIKELIAIGREQRPSAIVPVPVLRPTTLSEK